MSRGVTPQFLYYHLQLQSNIKSKVKKQTSSKSKFKRDFWSQTHSQQYSLKDYMWIQKLMYFQCWMSTASWIHAMVSIYPSEDSQFNQQRKQMACIGNFSWQLSGLNEVICFQSTVAKHSLLILLTGYCNNP